MSPDIAAKCLMFPRIGWNFPPISPETNRISTHLPLLREELQTLLRSRTIIAKKNKQNFLLIRLFLSNFLNFSIFGLSEIWEKTSGRFQELSKSVVRNSVLWKIHPPGKQSEEGFPIFGHNEARTGEKKVLSTDFSAWRVDLKRCFCVFGFGNNHTTHPEVYLFGVWQF